MGTTPALLTAVAVLVCLAPLHAQRFQQPVAKVVDLSGQVSVLDGDSGFQKPLYLGLEVKQTQVIVTGPDGWAKFQYTEDGSTFEIFPKSKVVFQEHPADWQHLLNIWIGHVKVWIQHAPGVPNYKNVNTPTAVISVRGTIFSVDVVDEDTTVVSVETGIVDVKNTTVPITNVPRLTDGQSITVIRGVAALRNPNNNNKNIIVGKAVRAVEQAVYEVIMQRRGSIGLAGSGPIGTGAQGDKGKTTGTAGTGTGGAPTPPSAPTPPPAPPPPGGGH